MKVSCILFPCLKFINILQVDGENYNPYIQFIDTNTVLFEGTSNLLHVAGLPKTIENQEYRNFKGCISSEHSKIMII